MDVGGVDMFIMGSHPDREVFGFSEIYMFFWSY